MNFTILRFDSIDSTNIEAMKQARHGADEGLCVIARQQTAGRGRQGRNWVSPPDAGLYLSIALRPKLEPKYLPLITFASAIAVFDSISELGLEPDIKWPNDVLVNEKKVCGILAEAAETDLGLAVVVGIGVNLTSESMPTELAETATSIEGELQRSVSISELESSVLNRLNVWYRSLSDDDGPSLIVKEWSIRSTYATGKLVRAFVSSDDISGVTDGVEQDGALRVITHDGVLLTIHAGDIERLRPVKQFD